MTTYRSKPDESVVHASGWVELPGLGVEVTCVPLVDTTHAGVDVSALFARLTYDDALEVAARYGARLISSKSVEALRAGVQLVPYLGTPTAETDLVHSQRHDADVWRQLRACGWDGRQAVGGAGKHWVDGAPAGRSRLMGWWDGKRWIQPLAVAHNRQHFDDGTTTMLERDIDAAERITRPELPPPPKMSPPSSESRPASPSPADTSVLGGGGVVDAVVGAIREAGRAVAMAARSAAADPTPPADESSPLLPGIDVSSNQTLALFDWPRIAERYKWCIARATYGVRPDKLFLDVVKRAQDAGMQVGGYLFFRQHQAREAQLGAFLEQLAKAGLGFTDIAPAIDLEDNVQWDGPLDVGAHNTEGRWLVEEVERLFGVALIYTAPYHWQNLGRPRWMAAHPVWVADYGKGRTEPRWPADWAMWQTAPKKIGGYADGRGPQHVIDTNVARRLPLATRSPSGPIDL